MKKYSALMLFLFSVGSEAKTCDLYFSNSLVINSVALADDEKTQQIGLSNKSSSEIANGMLFVWDDLKPRVFWMKNTTVPITAVFFNADDVVEKIEEMEPNTSKLHISAGSGRLALELISNSKLVRIAVGSKLDKYTCK